jgi:signal transduction histidine kinase
MTTALALVSAALAIAAGMSWIRLSSKLGELEAHVRELAAAHEARLEGAKAAALSQFANGIAHELNSPAAVVASSLRFIAESAAAPGAPPLDADSAEALADALVAMEQITSLVRELVDAGRSGRLTGSR